VAFEVKITAYSSAGARKCESTARRARSTNSVDAAEAGLSECGFPKQAPRIRPACAASCACAGKPAPV
jgi:hypothetical protein